VSTHLVLGGGGAMGAFQAGALVALLDAGVVPDALYGSSAGALNAAFLASRPDLSRAHELATWWSGATAGALLSPGWRSHARGLAAAVRAGGHGLLDPRPLRRLVAAQVPAHDLSELALPLSVTTTCLDCGTARHHQHGPVADLLVASCALPGLFAPVRLPGGHLHVDGGVLEGVPIGAALTAAGPQDRVLVLDCGLAPVTGRPDSCAAVSEALAGQACGLPVEPSRSRYLAPVETSMGALEVLLRSFAVARGAANRAAVKLALDDPRVQVLPHIADAWAAGLLDVLPTGPRDGTRPLALVRAGRLATEHWLASQRSPVLPATQQT